jgi:uracil-DNA glycosylase
MISGPPQPSVADQPGAPARWRRVHRELLTCTRCVETGHIGRAAPIFQGRPGQRLMLVGQAPGIVETGPRKPFAGRSGRELERWMQRAGFRDDDHFRSLTYVTSMTKCFPGRNSSGGGDRRPSAVEVASCAPWLDAQLELQRPRLILLAGALAIERFLPGRPLDGVVGRMFDGSGAETSPGRATAEPYLVPMPHPSGASRWLNAPAHRELLARSLELLAQTWPALA